MFVVYHQNGADEDNRQGDMRRSENCLFFFFFFFAKLKGGSWYYSLKAHESLGIRATQVIYKQVNTGI